MGAVALRSPSEPGRFSKSFSLPRLNGRDAAIALVMQKVVGLSSLTNFPLALTEKPARSIVFSFFL